MHCELDARCWGQGTNVLWLIHKYCESETKVRTRLAYFPNGRIESTVEGETVSINNVLSLSEIAGTEKFCYLRKHVTLLMVIKKIFVANSKICSGKLNAIFNKSKFRTVVEKIVYTEKWESKATLQRTVSHNTTYGNWYHIMSSNYLSYITNILGNSTSIKWQMWLFFKFLFILHW